ncbi:MAG: acyltransferase [Solobacterium sp.]|jgi:peptidoglycan/LPS O-acetylase OafA/YrhL|nr:acyltransferase [Solobacterium sp.]
MNYSILSKYRRTLMGFATLWVALLHAQMWFSFAPLQWVKVTGHGGVEIFLFLSAFGLYYAYQKGEHGVAFFKRRILRILPYFIPVVLFRIWYLKEPLDESIRLLTATSFWITGDRSMWFISALVIFYALTPLYLKFFNGREVKMTVITIIICLVLGLFFQYSLQLIFVASLPCFFLGFLAGYWSFHQKPVTKKEMIIGLCMLAAGIILQVISYSLDVDDALLFGRGMYWYPHVLIVFPLCILLAKFSSWCEQHKPVLWMTASMNRLGEVSLEFYLIHELMIQVWSNILFVSEQYSYHGIVLNVIIILLTYVVSMVWHAITDYLLSLCHSKKQAVQS